MIDFVKIVDGHLQVIYENKVLKKGVSGLMRVRDDAEFVAASIDSCIDALDELIIVYNDCTDDTPKIVKEKAKQYPDKIRVYEYPYKVYAVNLTKEEYDYITNEPLDSPHRLCNYYNFALSKVKYQHAVKIDADQIYFTEKLKYWCDAYRAKDKFTLNNLIGFSIFIWITFNFKVKVCKHSKFLYYIQNEWLKESYYSFIHWLISHNNKICPSLSGLNTFKYKGKWIVPLGEKTKELNIPAPFNGVGDHLIFKVTDNCYYFPSSREMDFGYAKQRSVSFTSIERFHLEAHSVSIGTTWFHLSCMRLSTKRKILNYLLKNNSRFMELKKFQYADFYKTISKMIGSDFVSNYKLNQLLHCYNNIDYIKQIKFVDERIA